jgi:hypothetical protein
MYGIARVPPAAGPRSSEWTAIVKKASVSLSNREHTSCPSQSSMTFSTLVSLLFVLARRVTAGAATTETSTAALRPLQDY